MKQHLFALLLFIGCLAPLTTVSAQTILLLHPNEAYKAPPTKEMIVMDENTFGNYHYTATQYDTLKQEVIRLDSALVKQDSVEDQLTRNYDRLLFLKQSEITTYQESYNRLQVATNDCIKHENQLQVDYLKLEQKNKRVKRWRNWFMGTTAFLGTVIILSVVK